MKNTNPAALSALVKGDLENFIVASTPGGIERQEKAGQTALVSSTNMPLELSPGREAFEKVGFTFGEPVDDVFQSAMLPAGWTRKATSHDMHSTIVDDQGRERVSVFYKAAFYDRRAAASLVCRYRVQTLFPGEDAVLAEDEITYVVLDCGREIHRTPTTKRFGDYQAGEERRKAAIAWLLERYPDAHDPTAYW